MQGMDAEEVLQLLAQLQSRCQILEADIEVEVVRSTKYLNILDTTGEDSSGATQPEVSRVPDAVRSTLARPTLPAASVCCPSLCRERVLMLRWMALSRHRLQRC